MRYSIAVFDFDGTLADTRGPILGAMRATLPAHGYPEPDPERLLGYVGRPLHTVFGLLGCRAQDVDALATTYLARFDEFEHLARLFDGIDALLDAFAGAGGRLAIATQRGFRSLDRLLVALGQRERFEFLVSGTCGARDKPDPEMLARARAHFGAPPGDVLMIGDTTLDVEMGHAAGVDTCAVTYGAQPRETLLAAEPTRIADSVNDLRTLLH